MTFAKWKTVYHNPVSLRLDQPKKLKSKAKLTIAWVIKFCKTGSRARSVEKGYESIQLRRNLPLITEYVCTRTELMCSLLTIHHQKAIVFLIGKPK